MTPASQLMMLRFGIFINVGCEACHGKLQLPRFLGNQLIRGQAFAASLLLPVSLIGNATEEQQRSEQS